MTTTVNILDAIAICKKVELVVAPLDCHVALTGGTLYKSGQRKDLDLLFYRVRQVEHPDKELILNALKSIGFKILRSYNWCTKAEFEGIEVDLFFPELHPELSPNKTESNY